MLKKLNWGHGIAIALGLFIIFILSLIFFFTRKWENSEMISDNYYEEELAYQQVIDAKNNAQALPYLPKYQQDAQGIHITFPSDIRPSSNSVRFHLYRTDDARLDVKKEERLSANGILNIPPHILKQGSYTLKVMWEINKKNYQVDYDLLWN